MPGNHGGCHDLRLDRVVGRHRAQDHRTGGDLHIVAELQPSDSNTICPYKGRASYHSVSLESGETIDDLVWYYPDPLPEALMIKDLVCFYNEHVDIELDGELQERPESPWSHGANRAANALPVETRG